MPAPVTGPSDSPDSTSMQPVHRREALICLTAALVALAIVWYDLAQPQGLYAVKQYDDGVYFGAAVRLVSGVLPYRDYVFLQPPGIAVLGAPIAWLTGHNTRDGLAL